MCARSIPFSFPFFLPSRPPQKDNQSLTSPSFPEWNAAAHGDSQREITPNTIALKEGPSPMSFSKERIVLPGRPGRRGLHQTSNSREGPLLSPIVQYTLGRSIVWSRALRTYPWWFPTPPMGRMRQNKKTVIRLYLEVGAS